ncbi:MAG: putative lipid II flippase FtsW [Patescibacteria group bacterium]|jgi:cell division protein FtsW
MSEQKGKPDYVLLGTVLALSTIGLIMIASASSVFSFQRFDDPAFLFRRQLISFIIGLAALLIALRIDYRIWRRFTLPLFLLTLGLLLAVFIPGLGTEFLGASRWIQIGGFTFQPTEIAKLTFILYLAAWLQARQKHMGTIASGLVPFLIFLGILALLVMAQPDLGTMIIIGITAILVYFLAGAPWRHIGAVFGLSAASFAILVLIAPYRAARLNVFLNPELDPQGIGYHINQALLAIGSGGIFGLGLGHSRQKFNYLPEASGDSIFAVIAEELGLIFGLVILGLFVFFFIRGMGIARSAKDPFARYVAAGITIWLSVQAMINIGAISGLLPLTGIPLPFISLGGTALIVSLGAVGILLNISKETGRQGSRPQWLTRRRSS